MEAEPTRHIVIATIKTLSTGVSVHAIFYAGFCMLGKSSNVALQSVGRLLRKHPLKQKAVIIDISQKLHCTPSIAEDSKGFKWIPDSYRYANYDIRHFGVRKRIYEAERYDVDENVTLLCNCGMRLNTLCAKHVCTAFSYCCTIHISKYQKP